MAPEIYTTTDIKQMLGRSNATVSRLLKPYKRLMISTRPYTLTAETLNQILSRQVPTDLEIKRKERRTR